MAEAKRVLITGVARFLGLRLARHLLDTGDVNSLVGVDLEEPPIEIAGMEFVRADISNPLIARVIDATGVDTIVHTNISSGRRAFGSRSQLKENNVIGTKRLLAAAQRSKQVKRVVVKSSTAIYGAGPGEPSLIPEDHAAHESELGGYGKDCADAETFARDFGRRRPDVDLLILRTQNVVGPTVRTSMCEYLTLPVIPTVLGFDPRLQLLHESDAVEALYRAVHAECTGIFNIAGDGVVYLSQAARILRKLQLPLPLPLAKPTAGMVRRLNLVDFPIDQLKMLLYGRVVNTRRARTVLGLEPKFSTEQTLVQFRDLRRPDVDPAPGVGSPPAWEHELVEYLRRATGGRRRVW